MDSVQEEAGLRFRVSCSVPTFRLPLLFGTARTRVAPARRQQQT